MCPKYVVEEVVGVAADPRYTGVTHTHMFYLSEVAHILSDASQFSIFLLPIFLTPTPSGIVYKKVIRTARHPPGNSYPLTIVISLLL
jgi:hypothetical protein